MKSDDSALTRLFDDIADLYEILECYIGDESVVCRARDRELQRQVAIKTPQDAIMADGKRLARYLEEARNLAGIEHPNVLPVYQFFDAGVRGQRCFLVTKWFDQNLTRHQAERSLDTKQALDVFAQILAGIAAIHAKDLLHRDLTPDNVLVSADLMQVCIADFGAVERAGADSHLIGPSARYQPPETYDTELPFDERADLYSAGFIAYEMLLGPTFFGEAFEAVLSADSDDDCNRRWANWHIGQLPRSLLTKVEVPEAVSMLVARLLDKDPERRFDSADAVLDELAKARGDVKQGPAVVLEDMSKTDPKPKPKEAGRGGKTGGLKLSWIIGGVVGGLVLLVILLLAISGPGPDKPAALAAIEALKAAKAAAVAAGADKPTPVDAFAAAEASADVARGLFQDKDYKAALAPLNQAAALFLESEAVALAWPDAESARAQAAEARDAAAGSEGMDAYRSAEAAWTEAETAFGKRDYPDSIPPYQQATQEFAAARTAWQEQVAAEQAQAEAQRLAQMEADRQALLEEAQAQAEAERLAKIEADRQVLLEQAQAARTEAEAARSAAASAADTAAFAAGELAMSEAAPRFDAEDWQPAIEGYRLATSHFADALRERSVLDARGAAETLRGQALEAGVGDQELTSGDTAFAAGTTAQQDQHYDDAEAAFVAAGQAFASVLSQAGSSEPVEYRVGSEEAEIAAAFQLCQDHRADCRRADYESEATREIRLKPFAIDETEATNARFALFVSETGYTTESERRGFSYMPPAHAFLGDYQPVRGADWRHPDGPESSISGRDDLPSVHLTRSDAIAYCQWAGGRLPSEAEWEFGARGLERRVFPWGNAWNQAAVRDDLTPVGTIVAGRAPSGAADMAGSVWEWTATDLNGQAVLKGGSIREVANPANLRGAVQLVMRPDDSQNDVGFRCVYDAPRWSPSGEPNLVSSNTP